MGAPICQPVVPANPQTFVVKSQHWRSDSNLIKRNIDILVHLSNLKQEIVNLEILY